MKIRIRDLRCSTIIGTTESERQNPQEVQIDLELDVGAWSAVRSDCLDDAMDYANLAEEITGRLSESKFFLLEKLANEVLQWTLQRDGVMKATVEVSKPNALPGPTVVSVVATGKNEFK